jgi:hypothetical protein
MGIFSDPLFFSILFKDLNPESRSTLRLVNKELRDAVNLNAQGLRCCRGNLDPVSMSRLVSKLPNLKSIKKKFFQIKILLSVFQAAQFLQKLSKLELYFLDFCRNQEDAIGALQRALAESLYKATFAAARQHHWLEIKSLHITGMDMTVTVQSMEGLLHLSTLTQVDLIDCRFNNESFSLILPLFTSS